MSVSGSANVLTRKQDHLRQVLVETLTDDDVRAVTKKLVELAEEGDLRATRLLLHYALGKPGQSVSAGEPRPLPASGKIDLPPLPPLPTELIREQIRKEAAVNKRCETAPPRLVSAPPGAAAATETMRLVNLPEGKPRS